MPTDSKSSPSGHLFIVNSDLARLKCDAVLVPTDGRRSITAGFGPLVGASGRVQLGPVADGSWFTGAVALFRESTEESPDVWLGNLGGDESTSVRQFVQCAHKFVIDAAARVKARASGPVPPLIALPVVGSGRGGGAQRRGRILGQLVPTLMKAARSEGVDVVLVTWGRVTFEAAQAVRRSFLAANPSYSATLDEGLEATASNLAAQAKAGNLVIFVGAGVSATAGLPAWQSLLDDVAERLSYRPSDIARLHELDVRDQATLLARKRSFRDEVQKVLGAGNFSLVHGLLASLPVREYVTTNFDQLLEAAASGPGAQLSVVPGESLRPGGRWLVKLHGTLGRDLVLTRSEFRDARSQHGALFGLLQALIMTRHMLFVGYSLQDEDFNDVMHDVRLFHQRTPDDKRRRLGTILTSFDNPEFSKLWRDLDVRALAPRRRVVDGQLTTPTRQEWGRVGRTLAILLDRVAMDSASEVGFLSDSTMGGVSATGPAKLNKALAALSRAYAEYSDESGSNAQRWAEVRAALDSLSTAAQEKASQDG